MIFSQQFKVRPRNLRLLLEQKYLETSQMKLIVPKFAASACLFALLVAPAGVFAQDRNDRDNKGKNRYAVPEPSTLVMTLVGMGLGIGLVIAGLRRNRSTSAA
jgi:hypothetical protein